MGWRSVEVWAVAISLAFVAAGTLAIEPAEAVTSGIAGVDVPPGWGMAFDRQGDGNTFRMTGPIGSEVSCIGLAMNQPGMVDETQVEIDAALVAGTFNTVFDDLLSGRPTLSRSVEVADRGGKILTANLTYMDGDSLMRARAVFKPIPGRTFHLACFGPATTLDQTPGLGVVMASPLDPDRRP